MHQREVYNQYEIIYPAIVSDHSQVSGNSVRTLVVDCGCFSGLAPAGAANWTPSRNTCIFFRRYVHAASTEHAEILHLENTAKQVCLFSWCKVHATDTNKGSE